MRTLVPVTVLLTTVALAACATGQAANGARTQASAVATSTMPPAGAAMRRGDSFALMAQQYDVAHAGPVAATGASAWVAPSPAPAFVINTPLPPAAPAAPPPAAVANRQPAPALAAPASELARPEAAAPAAEAAPAKDPAVRTAGLALFNANGCGGCHMFPDANAFGEVGPPLNSGLAVRTIVNTLNDGRGAMPSFKGALSDAEILALANYIAQYGR